MSSDITPRTNRRRFLIGVGTAAVAVPAPVALALQMPSAASPADNLASASEQVSHTADQISRAMQAIHGGTWRIHIDHDAQFVVVSRNFAMTARDAEAL